MVRFICRQVKPNSENTWRSVNIYWKQRKRERESDGGCGLVGGWERSTSWGYLDGKVFSDEKCSEEKKTWRLLVECACCELDVCARTRTTLPHKRNNLSRMHGFNGETNKHIRITQGIHAHTDVNSPEQLVIRCCEGQASARILLKNITGTGKPLHLHLRIVTVDLFSL